MINSQGFLSKDGNQFNLVLNKVCRLYAWLCINLMMELIRNSIADSFTLLYIDMYKLPVKSRGQIIEYPLPKEFTVFRHGAKYQITIDAVTLHGVSYREQRVCNHFPERQPAAKRKYVAISTFYNMAKHRVA